MDARSPHRPLSIGEFAAATQLTPKALRLYDEQDLLRPASIDPANGYRYYRSDQVPIGRLIRVLREMDLTLAQIAQVVATRGAQTELLLHSLAQEVDRRYAKEKRAFQSALMLLRAPAGSDAPAIEVIERPSITVSVRPFTADRNRFVERFTTESRLAREEAGARGVKAVDEASCSLVDPLSDDEGQLEVLLPVAPTAAVHPGLTLRHLPASRCAAVTSRSSHAHAAEFTAALDALFDWFDRQGHRVIGAPAVTLRSGDTNPGTHIFWAFESRS